LSHCRVSVRQLILCTCVSGLCVRLSGDEESSFSRRLGDWPAVPSVPYSR